MEKVLSDHWGRAKNTRGDRGSLETDLRRNYKDYGGIGLKWVEQKNEHFAVGEIMVTHENVSVVYRLAYDEEMRLAEMYIRQGR